MHHKEHVLLPSLLHRPYPNAKIAIVHLCRPVTYPRVSHTFAEGWCNPRCLRPLGTKCTEVALSPDYHLDLAALTFWPGKLLPFFSPCPSVQ